LGKQWYPKRYIETHWEHRDTFDVHKIPWGIQGCNCCSKYVVAKLQAVLDDALVERVPNVSRRSMDIQLFRTEGGHYQSKLMTAFVTFANEQNAEDSLRLNGQRVNGLTIWRPLVVEPAAPRLSYKK
jgi:hypothetical protein